jgi:hypothetical protein
MSLRRALALSLLSTCAAACATTAAERPAVEVDVARYIPLGVGASWTYAVRYPGQDGEMTVRLTEEKDGYWLDDRGGAWRLTRDGLRDRMRYLVKRPAVEGTSWRTVVGPSAVEHAQITHAGAPCEVRAGSFPRCLVVHSWIKQDDKLTLHIEWTFVEDVGLARLDTYADIRGKGQVPQVRQDLIRWTLPGGQGGAAPAAPPPSAVDAEGAPAAWSSP